MPFNQLRSIVIKTTQRIMIDERIELIERLQNSCIDIATGRGYESREYQQLRSEVLNRPGLANGLPGFVRTNRDAKQFWAFIKKQADNYADRRVFIWDGFKSLIEQLESERRSPSDETANSVLPNLSSAHVSETWQRALQRRTEDPKGAITLARSLLEAVCKHILDDASVEYMDDITLPKLYAEAAKLLNLAPSQHTEVLFKKILGGCSSVVEGLGALRNKSGDAHGRGMQNTNPSPRHAELAVNLSGAMSTFLVSTWESQKLRQNTHAG